MLRLCEEQREILNSYSGTKEEVIEEMKRAVSFIEDMELREMAEDIVIQIGKMGNDEFAKENGDSMKNTF